MTKFLLDTHVFVWTITDPSRLSQKVNKIILDRNNELYLSVISAWEMAIKARLGKLSLPRHFKSFLTTQLQENETNILPINMNHALHIYELPQHHRDPFDRMLIAQSHLENLPILSNDSVFGRYPVKVIW